MKKNKLIAIVGTTASGKSSLGIELAKIYGAEIVSADSRQVYRTLDLGTGKVTVEECDGVPHHMLDIIEPGTPFSMAEYQTLAYEAIDGIIERGNLPMLVGGTGLYTRSVIEGYNLVDGPPNEELRASLADKGREELLSILSGYGVKDIAAEVSERRMVRMIEKLSAGFSHENENSPRYDVLQLGITFPRDVLYARILERLDMRIRDGMIEEVEGILKNGATPEFLEGLGLEYRYTYRYLAGKYSGFEEYRDELYREICHFAKRQVTWFKKEKNIVWLDESGDYLLEARRLIDSFLEE